MVTGVPPRSRTPETQPTQDVDVVDAEPAQDADVVDVDAKPDAEPDGDISGTVALQGIEEWMEPAEDWPHEWLDFEGDKLAVRKPTQQALSAFSLASSRFVKLEIRNDITGLFIARHLSQESYARVFSRLMDPDDDNYTNETVGALMREIVQLRTGKQESAAK